MAERLRGAERRRGPGDTPAGDRLRAGPGEGHDHRLRPTVRSRAGTTGDVPAGGCEIRFGLPSAYESAHNSSVRVTFTAVADAALVARHYAEDLEDARKRAGQGTSRKEFRDLGTSLGTDGCFLPDVSDGPTCHQGPYEFEVSGMSTADGVGEYPASERNWTEKVLTEVVRTLGPRMR
ncbi:hypothetical protein ACQ86F_05220 [Streptomyces venezuelae ATCC 10712]